MHALLHSPVVVRVATFPFFNFKVSSTCGGNPATWFPNWHFWAIRVATWGRKPPETPGNPRKPPKMLPGNPGMIVHGITNSKSIRCVHTQKRVGSNLALALSVLRPKLDIEAALADHGLRAFMGDDASQQPGSLWEMMLHETAVSWIRRGLTWTFPPRPWEETPTEFARRLRAVVEDINARHRVEGLCRELPQRVRALHAAQGGRLDK